MTRDSKHERLVETAKAAIDAVFSDTSVSKKITKRSMEELRDCIQEILEALS